MAAGWNLGENDLWAKMSNTELATHIPLLMRVPGRPNAVNASSRAFVEAVDLYLTLTELAGLPAPSTRGQAVNGVTGRDVASSQDAH